MGYLASRCSFSLIASRMNFARPYVPTRPSIFASVSGAIRTGVGFILSGGRPIGREIAGSGAAGKKTIPFSIDAVNDAVYINDIDYGSK
ncbi:hypothetical protein [Sphingomonas koreensis]